MPHVAPKPIDMTPRVALTAEKGPGPVRTRHPSYVTLLPPCNAACPAGEDIRGWLALVGAGAYREAWELLTRENPMPAVHGRVCYHPCEGGCNRTALDATVGIHAVERFLGDLAASQGWTLPIDRPASGRRVLIVGAGPAGLSAAYHLARLGHRVEIREAGPVPGGMLQFGIPAYRLPRDILMAEIRRIEAMGVRIQLNHRVEDVLAERASGQFDAVFVAIGAQRAKHIDIPARDATRVVDAVNLLRETGTGQAPLLGRQVVVYGGGNTAVDAARTARRLGACDALIVYHRDQAHMAAHAFETQEAAEEGVRIRWLTSIREIAGTELRVERVELDANGRPQPTGEFETLGADAVILALGQQSDSACLKDVPGIALARDGTVTVGHDMMTGYPGIFAGGDMVPGERTVTTAVGHGKRAARNIDAWLGGMTYTEPEKPPLVGFDLLHLPIFSDAAPSEQRVLPTAERLGGFGEILAGLTEPEARWESARCLSCGHCYECDNCYAACPEGAIVKLGRGQGYRVDGAKCTGCAACFEQCPCHAIELVGEVTP